MQGSGVAVVTGQEDNGQPPADAGPSRGSGPGGPGSEVETLRLRPWARSWRLLLLLALAALFAAGTAVGTDNWWPFGPWRMFATSTAPSGSVVALKIEVQADGGSTWLPADLTPTSVGLNRAEIEGRVPQMTANPSILGTLITSHAQLRPHEPAWQAIRVVRSEVLLAHGAPTGKTRDTTLVAWPLNSSTVGVPTITSGTKE
jgi:hypothetical protein